MLSDGSGTKHLASGATNIRSQIQPNLRKLGFRNGPVVKSPECPRAKKSRRRFHASVRDRRWGRHIM